MVCRKIFPEAQGVAGAVPFPAPVRGLNTRESFAALQPDEAYELVNILPQSGGCTIRPGYSTYGTISGNKPVKTLAVCPVGGSVSLLAATNGGLYNIISGTPSTLATGYANDYWHTSFMGGYLFGVNGQDTPWRYDGSSISATGLSGPTLTSMNTMNNVMFRLWATVNNSGDVWYGPLEGVTGPLTKFAVSQIANGGYCMGVFEWPAQNATVMCFSTGQVLVYQGDPSTNMTLTSSTKYYAPPLIEPGAAVQMGGELVLITVSGPITMDLVAAGLGFELDALQVWGKIWPAWQADYAQYGANAGWFGKFIAGNVYFNVPTGGGVSKQYVFTTRNQAWTNYAKLPLQTLEGVNLNGVQSIYFGSANNDGNVYLHAGGQDNGNQIVSLSRSAFTYGGTPGKKKRYTQIKPNIFTTGGLSVQAQIDTDFNRQPVTAAITPMSAAGSSTPWGSSWGAPWATVTQNRPGWIGAAARGHSASAVVQIYSTGTDVKWQSSDVMATGGGSL